MKVTWGWLADWVDLPPTPEALAHALAMRGFPVASIEQRVSLDPAIIVGRDLLLSFTLPVLRRHGYGPPPVHYLGKAATFNLLYAFPLLLLGDGSGTFATVTRSIGWAFAVWGTVLYVWSGALYVVQVWRITRTSARTNVEQQEERTVATP